MYEAESGKLVVIPDSMEELLEVAKTKLNITRADRVFNNAGIVVDDVALIRDAGPCLVSLLFDVVCLSF